MKQFERAFVHIGLHKTGSSAIQLMCDENREVLARHGICYPEGRWQAQLGSYFAQNKLNYIYNKHAGNLNLPAIKVSDSAYVTRLEKELGRSKCNKLVISYEGFIDLTFEEICSLREFLMGYSQDVEIIAYCRHPLSFAASEASQRARMGLPPGFGDMSEPPVPLFKEYLEKFEKSFGKNRVNLADFATEKLYKGDICLDFLSRLGIAPDNHSDFRIDESPSNESLSLEAIRIAEVMARRSPRTPYANLFFMKYSELLESIRGVRPVLSKAAETWIMEISGPHLAYLTETFGLTLLAPKPIEVPPALFGEKALESLADLFLSADLVSQAYRWLLGREPESQEVVLGHLAAAGGDWRRIRSNIMKSPEFAKKAISPSRDFAAAAAEGKPTVDGGRLQSRSNQS